MIKVMLISFLLIIIFWAAFEQAGGLMNLYAAQKTNRHIDFLNWEVPASWFQAVNSFFIITLGTFVAGFWYNRKRKGKEASSIFKIAMGVMIMGWGFLFMSAASVQYQNQGHSAMYWLIFAYLLHTIGELSASPVTLSYVTKLAPVKYASLMMGLFWAATGMGNYVAGWVGVWSQTAGELQIFTGIAIFCTVCALLVISLLKPLKRLAHGAEDSSPEEQVPIANTAEIEINPSNNNAN
jgi:POT family proton-dependent oligopeptide transporter